MWSGHDLATLAAPGGCAVGSGVRTALSAVGRQFPWREAALHRDVVINWSFAAARFLATAQTAEAKVDGRPWFPTRPITLPFGPCLPVVLFAADSHRLCGQLWCGNLASVVVPAATRRERDRRRRKGPAPEPSRNSERGAGIMRCRRGNEKSLYWFKTSVTDPPGGVGR
jgi:hypothetical protein